MAWNFITPLTRVQTDLVNFASPNVLYHHHAAKEKAGDARAMLAEHRTVNSIKAVNTHTLVERSKRAHREMKAMHQCGHKNWNINRHGHTGDVISGYLNPLSRRASLSHFGGMNQEN